MSIVSLCPLVLTFITLRFSLSAVTVQPDNERCYTVCPAGHHRNGACNEPQTFHCEKCTNGSTYLDLENLEAKCRICTRCDSRRGYKVKQACSYNSDTICSCKENYFNADRYGLNCQSCSSCSNCAHISEYVRVCQPCQSDECKKDMECWRKCANKTATAPTTVTTSTTTATKTATTVTSLHTRATPTNRTKPNNVAAVGNDVVLCLLGVVVAFLLLLVILVVFTRPSGCRLRWIIDKEQKLKEHHIQQLDQPGSPTTLTLKICEGPHRQTPNYSPVTPDHPGLVTPLLATTDEGAVRKEEHTVRWPAIVLYAIIKEVPLRRWKEFLRLLSVTDQDLERVELEASPGLGLMEKQYLMLRLWSQQPAASLDQVYSAMHYMDLAGCAQLLQDRIEKLHESR